MISIIKPYNDAVKNIFYNGIKTDSTLALFNQTITFDLSKMNDLTKKDYSLYMPLKRGSLITSPKYGIAEAVWYMHATNEIDLILPFGKIWKSMTDENGHVNSNYGYQLKKNQDLLLKFKEFDDVLTNKSIYKTVDFYIASRENQYSRSDLVCNNKIEITLKRSIHNKLLLSARIVARSIDVIFGLPYDMFAAQGFMTLVAHYLNKKTGYLDFVNLDYLKFDIVNLHWYLSQKPTLNEINELSDEALIIKNSYHLPFNMTKEQINELNEIDKIKNYRDIITDNDSFTKIICSRELIFNSELDEIIFDDEQSVIDYFEMISDIHKDDTIMSRVMDIIKILKENEFDRKSLIVDNSFNLYYITLRNSKFYLYIEKG